MKWYSVVFAAMATTVIAKDNFGIPDCAVPCIKVAIKKATSCDWEDPKCVCDPVNAQKIKQAGSKCVLEKCGGRKAMKEVVPAVKKHCAGHGF